MSRLRLSILVLLISSFRRSSTSTKLIQAPLRDNPSDSVTSSVGVLAVVAAMRLMLLLDSSATNSIWELKTGAFAENLLTTMGCPAADLLEVKFLSSSYKGVSPTTPITNSPVFLSSGQLMYLVK